MWLATVKYLREVLSCRIEKCYGDDDDDDDYSHNDYDIQIMCINTLYK